MVTFAEHIAALRGFADRAPAGAEAAANSMADEFRGVVRSVLLLRGHAFSTKTPAAPGTPPAFISKDLAASVVNEPAVETGPAAFLARSGPTARYARSQELGARPMTAHTPRGMRWQEPPGTWHTSMAHDLPARPYMKPALELAAGDGTLEDAAVSAFEAAVYGG